MLFFSDTRLFRAEKSVCKNNSKIVATASHFYFISEEKCHQFYSVIYQQIDMSSTTHKMNAIKILSNHKQQITIQTSASTLISKLKKDKSSCTAHKINAIKILAVYNPQTTFQTTTSILVSKIWPVIWYKRFTVLHNIQYTHKYYRTHLKNKETVTIFCLYEQ